MDVGNPHAPDRRGVAPRALEVALCLGLATASLTVPSAPGYDAWSWLQWGREAASLELATEGGPAFKPLPVAVTAMLAPTGATAPDLWLLLARTASLLGALAAGRLAWRLSGRSLAAGVAAAVGVVLCAGWMTGFAAGGAEAPLIFLVLLAFERALVGRPGQALAVGLAAALLRVETWPFLALYAVWVWRREPRLRRWIVAGAMIVPLCWLGPEALSTGDAWRSGARATVPNPGAPALADRPALASLERAASLPLLPLALAGLLAVALPATRWARDRTARPEGAAIALLAVAGLSGIALVAAMSELGFSGEERYALPGAAVLSAAGAAALGRLAAGFGRRRALAVVVVAVAGFAPSVVARADEVRLEARRSLEAAALADDLEATLAAVGGRGPVLACGRPFVGPYRGPLLAWHLGVAKARVGFVPRRPGVVFRSRLAPGAAPAPQVPRGERFEPLARRGRWEVLAACRSGSLAATSLGDQVVRVP